MGRLTPSPRSPTTCGTTGRRIALDLRHDKTQEESLDRLRGEIADLRASRERILLGGDAERHRIERSLHRGVQQELVALAVKLQLVGQQLDASPREAEALLEDAGRNMQRVLEQAARLAQRIYPSLLDETGLAVALRAAVVDGDLAASVAVDVGESCPPELTRTVYMCCLEAVERADEATITVREEDGALIFEVTGEKIRPAMVDTDPSFEWLRDRVEALAGRLTVEHGPGDRVRVSGSLPLSR